MNDEFKRRLAFLESQQEEMLNKKNELLPQPSGVFARYKHPVLTAMHTPLTWRYDLDPLTNPYLLERFTINATLNLYVLFYKHYASVNNLYFSIIYFRNDP